MTPDEPNTCSMSDASSHIIVLEPDPLLAKVIAMSIWAETGMSPCLATTAPEAVAFIHDHPNTIFAAAVWLDSPGANAMLEKMVEHSVPAIVYGDDFSDDTRKHLSTMSIADIVLGERDVVPGGVGASMARLVANRETPILVVDDSRSMRLALSRFLKTRCYRIHEAADGMEALDILEKHPDIKLVITDNEMPRMDGYSLIKKIRKTHSKEDLAVIGISAQTNALLSVRFINNGANDFLHKPFVKEELYCRVDHNLDMLSRIKTIRDLSYKDSLTRLHNRRFFFENCQEFSETAKSENKLLTVAMIDIDHFKSVNDTYGHDTGDIVLKKVSSIIADSFSEDAIVSRFGGEEFCILAAHEPGTDVFSRYDKVRRAIEASPVKTDDFTISVTVSVGVCAMDTEVEEMIKAADAFLYSAKESGRNRVVIS